MIKYPKPAKKPKVYKPVRKTKKTTRASLSRMADKLWSQVVKRIGRCEFTPSGYDQPHECRGPLQAMHGISRRYRGTRWLPINGFAGCASRHMYYTHREGEWQAFLVKAWGLPVYEELWAKARAKAYPDLPVIIEGLRAEVSR